MSSRRDRKIRDLIPQIKFIIGSIGQEFLETSVNVYSPEIYERNQDLYKLKPIRQGSIKNGTLIYDLQPVFSEKGFRIIEIGQLLTFYRFTFEDIETGEMTFLDVRIRSLDDIDGVHNYGDSPEIERHQKNERSGALDLQFVISSWLGYLKEEDGSLSWYFVIPNGDSEAYLNPRIEDLIEYVKEVESAKSSRRTIFTAKKKDSTGSN